MQKNSDVSIVYQALAIFGLVVTWIFNGQYLLEGGGLGPQAFFGTAFANPLTTAITLDIYLSAVVFSLWLIRDSREQDIPRPWLYVILCFCLGLAVALPLYLARREKALNAATCEAHPHQR